MTAILASALVLQSEVAAAIANEINLALSPEVKATLAVKRPVSAAAHEDYLKGRYYLNRPHPESLAQSVAWFESAIVKDAGFPLAYSSLSHALALLAMVPFDVLPPHASMPKARMAAMRALEPRCATSGSAFRSGSGAASLRVGLERRGRRVPARACIEWRISGSAAALCHGCCFLYRGKMKRFARSIMRNARRGNRSTFVSGDPGHSGRRPFTSRAEYDHCIRECFEAMELDPNYFLLHYLLARRTRARQREPTRRQGSC